MITWLVEVKSVLIISEFQCHVTSLYQYQFTKLIQFSNGKLMYLIFDSDTLLKKNESSVSNLRDVKELWYQNFTWITDVGLNMNPFSCLWSK